MDTLRFKCSKKMSKNQKKETIIKIQKLIISEKNNQHYHCLDHVVSRT